MLLLDGSLTLARRARPTIHPPRLSRTMPPAKFLFAEFFPSEDALGISTCFARCCVATACRLVFTVITRHLRPQRRRLDDRRTTRWKTATYPVRSCSRRNSASPTFRQQPAGQGPRRTSLGCCFKIASPVNCGLPTQRTSTPANPCCAASSPTTTIALAASLAKWKRLGVRLPDSLDRICCFLHERIVSNDNVVQWDGRHFQIPPSHRFSFAGAKVQICESLRGSIAIYHGDSKLHHADLQGGDTFIGPLR